MKKAIHISIIILFIIAACVTEQIITKMYFRKTIDLVSSLQFYAENNEEINTPLFEEKAKELESYWQTKESIICTFVNHKEIEDVGIEINKLQTAVKQNNREAFIESLNLIFFYLDGYEHVVGINLQSIF